MDMNTVMYPEISGDAAMKMDEIQWCEDENGYERAWTIPLMLWFLQILRH
jgi:hypothetical protein